jgi:hypothetical protein
MKCLSWPSGRLNIRVSRLHCRHAHFYKGIVTRRLQSLQSQRDVRYWGRRTLEPRFRISLKALANTPVRPSVLPSIQLYFSFRVSGVKFLWVLSATPVKDRDNFQLWNITVLNSFKFVVTPYHKFCKVWDFDSVLKWETFSSTSMGIRAAWCIP